MDYILEIGCSRVVGVDHVQSDECLRRDLHSAQIWKQVGVGIWFVSGLLIWVVENSWVKECVSSLSGAGWEVHRRRWRVWVLDCV